MRRANTSKTKAPQRRSRQIDTYGRAETQPVWSLGTELRFTLSGGHAALLVEPSP
jgi:hypothetical protein